MIRQGLSRLCKVEVYLIDLKLFDAKDMQKPVVRHFSHVDTLGMSPTHNCSLLSLTSALIIGFIQLHNWRNDTGMTVYVYVCGHVRV